MIPESLYIETQKKYLAFRGHKKNNRCKVIPDEGKIIYSKSYADFPLETVENNDHWSFLLRNRMSFKNMGAAFRNYQKEYDWSILQNIEKELIQIDPIYFTCRAKSFILEELEEELAIKLLFYMRERNFMLTKEDEEHIHLTLKNVLMPCLQHYGRDILFENPELCFNRIIQYFDDFSNELKENTFLQKGGIWITPLRIINFALDIFHKIALPKSDQKAITESGQEVMTESGQEAMTESGQEVEYLRRKYEKTTHFFNGPNSQIANNISFLDTYFEYELEKAPENGLLFELRCRNQELLEKTYRPFDKSNDAKIITNSFLEIILIQMARFLSETPSPRVAICHNCGKIFIGGRKNQTYCNYPSPQNSQKTCAIIGKNVTRKKKETEDFPGLALWNKLRNRLYKRVYNTNPSNNKGNSENTEKDLHKKYSNEYNDWISATQNDKELYKNGKLTQREFETRIVEQYVKITGEKEHI
ncbi:MAG TPA: hypothetical protein DF613_01880 [Lachnospiraceae bacterium]|nr:hypothetical protein [Lachnospiraceae bacterium]